LVPSGEAQLRVSKHADVNGVRLHYVTAGTGPLMLFLHGFPDFWMGWREALAEFSAHYQAVAPDLRGYNLSDKPAGVKAYRAATIVEDVRQLIAHLGHTKCILVAHDWGGAVAWNFAAQYPEAVERLVIVNSPHPLMFVRELARNPVQQAASDYMLMFRRDDAEQLLAANDYARVWRHLQSWLEGPHPPDAATVQAYHDAWAQPGALTAMLNWYRASPLKPIAADDPLLDALFARAEEFTVRMPTLVIWGERDEALLPGLLDGLDAYVPDLRIERIPEGTHWVVHEFPERVFAAIRNFLGR
jgi:pimeloyl-ACP methyl ester carboxylesterase